MTAECVNSDAPRRLHAPSPGGVSEILNHLAPLGKDTPMQEMQKLIEPKPVPSPIMESPWFVMLLAPQQELKIVGRLHELGLELFVPWLRERIKTRAFAKAGHRITCVIVRPMFPGYGFLRTIGIDNYDTIKDVHGIRGFMLDVKGD